MHYDKKKRTQFTLQKFSWSVCCTFSMAPFASFSSLSSLLSRSHSSVLECNFAVSSVFLSSCASAYWNRRYGRWGVCWRIVDLWLLNGPVSTPNVLLPLLFCLKSCVIILLGFLRWSNISWLRCIAATAVSLGLGRNLYLGFIPRS